MSTTVTYKGSTLTTVENQTRILNTAGTWLEDDITLVDVTSGSGNDWQSGIIQDTNGYICISPYTGAGGVDQDADGCLIFYPTQSGYQGQKLYLYLDADGYVHTSTTVPVESGIQKMLVVIIKEEYDYTYNTLVDSNDDIFVDSNGNLFLAVETE